jgi:phage tail-like protein
MKRSEIEHLLPGIFQRTITPGSPLWALLTVMEELHAPDEDVLTHLDSYFDPYRAPDDFIPYLAGWVDMARLLVAAPEEFTGTVLPPFPSGMGRLRELIAAAAFLAQWRGTAKGLQRFLITATGVSGFVIEEQVPGRPFHLRIQAPQAAAAYKDLIQRIIELEKPAYTTYELEVAAETPVAEPRALRGKQRRKR